MITSQTREQLQARLDAYIAAELRILTAGQQEQVGDGSTARTRQRADLDAVRKQIDALSAQIAAMDQAAAGQGRVVYARPIN
ncbi:MAG: hypothetical protein RL456_1649 [Pseudomonadota bacterium]|jgi:hypothetical protein